MKRILFLLFAIGLSASMTVMAGMSTGKVRKETRFLTDKMAYELNLSTQQYNDAYEINYDFVYSVRNIMDYVARGYEWALDDYYEALDIRNDDLRWVLSDGQYRRFMDADYFYRPIYVTGGRWNFRVYVNYPNHSLFYFGVPYHYRTYCGAHYRPHFHHASFYRDRYRDFHHYATPHRMRDERAFHSYRRSDFGSVRFRPNSSVRPHNAPSRPGMPSGKERPGKEVMPNRNNNRNDGNSHRRPEMNSNSVRRPATGNSTTSGSNRESRHTNSSSMENSSRRSENRSDRSNTNRSSNTERSSRSGSSSRNNSGSTRSNSSSSSTVRSSNRSNRSNVSNGKTERRSSSESTRSSSSSSRSSERGNGSRR